MRGAGACLEVCVDYPITNGIRQRPTNPDRLGILNTLAQSQYIAKGSQLDVLEIGSLFGDSARILGRYGHVMCVDMWDWEGGLQTFLSNTAHLSVDHCQGDSREILLHLKDEAYDLIYIDGGHTYPIVDLDIHEAKRLIKPGGIICGDDLEKQASSLDDYNEAEKLRTIDYIDGYHPGVTCAVFRELGYVNNEAGLWWKVIST